MFGRSLCECCGWFAAFVLVPGALPFCFVGGGWGFLVWAGDSSESDVVSNVSEGCGLLSSLGLISPWFSFCVLWVSRRVFVCFLNLPCLLTDSRP